MRKKQMLREVITNYVPVPLQNKNRLFTKFFLTRVKFAVLQWVRIQWMAGYKSRFAQKESGLNKMALLKHYWFVAGEQVWAREGASSPNYPAAQGQDCHARASWGSAGQTRARELSSSGRIRELLRTTGNKVCISSTGSKQCWASLILNPHTINCHQYRYCTVPVVFKKRNVF
jgi:hypothetical protein